MFFILMCVKVVVLINIFKKLNLDIYYEFNIKSKDMTRKGDFRIKQIVDLWKDSTIWFFKDTQYLI